MTRLSDVVGASGLSGYAIVALVLFVIAFVLILIPILTPRREEFYERAGRMPLDDFLPQTPSGDARGECK